MDEWHCALTLPRTRACRENTSEHDVYSMRTDVHDRRTYNNRSDSRTPCAMPPPHPKHRQPPQSHGGREDRQTPTEGQTGDTGSPMATGAAGADAGQIVGGGALGEIGQAGRRRDRPRQAEPPQTVRATQSRPGCRRGYSYHRRRRRGAGRHREPQTGLFVRGIDISSLPIYEPTEGRKPK